MSETFKLGTDNFVSLAENKLEFARRICSDRELAQCLLSQDRSFKDYELPENYQDQLLWHHVFPFRYVLDTQESQRAYITMSFEFEKSEKPNVWKAGAVVFYLFCHKDLVRTDYGVLRYDFMLSRLNALMRDSRFKTWYNRLEFQRSGDITVDEIGDYVGVEVIYASRGVL